MNSYVLLIDGPDEKGLVYKITQVIYNYNLNIIENNEFVDEFNSNFFMRSAFIGEIKPTEFILDLELILSKKFRIQLFLQKKKNIIIFVSKEHHCLADLLIRHEYNRLNANILGIVSNHEELFPLAKKFNIPFYYIPNNDQSREDHEKQILQIVNQYHPDYIILAKYMRILTPFFISQFKNQIINIHHSFLPAFIGKNPYEQAFKRGVKIIGATSHYVNENLDEGPIIVQEVIPITHKFTIHDMQLTGQDVEVITLAKALKYVFEDRVFINGNKTIIFS